MIPSDRLHPDSTAMGPHSHDKRAYNGSNHHQGISLLLARTAFSIALYSVIQMEF